MQKLYFETQEKYTDENNKVAYKNKISSVIRKNPKNPSVIVDYLHGTKTLRMFYNVEIISNNVAENKICSAYLNDKKWIKVSSCCCPPGLGMAAGTRKKVCTYV